MFRVPERHEYQLLITLKPTYTFDIFSTAIYSISPYFREQLGTLCFAITVVNNESVKQYNFLSHWLLETFDQVTFRKKNKA